MYYILDKDQISIVRSRWICAFHSQMIYHVLNSIVSLMYHLTYMHLKKCKNKRLAIIRGLKIYASVHVKRAKKIQKSLPMCQYAEMYTNMQKCRNVSAYAIMQNNYFKYAIMQIKNVVMQKPLRGP